MKTRQLLQALAPFSRQLHLHPAPVAAADAAPDQPGDLASRNQGHDSVMLRLQAFGELSHRRPFPTGEALDLEHQQVLQRGYALPVRHLFAKTEITAQLVTKVSKRFKIGF